MTEIYLNDLPGFQWASVGGNSKGFGKVSIDGESFWLRDCQQDEKGAFWHGIVDNDLVATSEHGLKLDDRVSFIIESR